VAAPPAPAASLRADVVVVGSGAGGSAVAGELARAGRSVLLVEAGPQLDVRPGWNMRNEFAPESDGFAEFVEGSVGFHGGVADGFEDAPGARVVHAVGGMLSHWTNNCPEQHAELERTPAIPADEWDAAMARARSLLPVAADLARGGVVQEWLRARLGDVVSTRLERPVQDMPVAARRTERGIVYAGADGLLHGPGDELPPGLRILPELVARELVVRGGRAVAVLRPSRSGSRSATSSAGTRRSTASGSACPSFLGA
jgi:glycine/D-amino acid oxidase-like deaminating enzyme